MMAVYGNDSHHVTLLRSEKNVQTAYISLTDDPKYGRSRRRKRRRRGFYPITPKSKHSNDHEWVILVEVACEKIFTKNCAKKESLP
ncbi:hypothetical protein TNCV_935521 [Trichonephila clavipes]|nr:hypothetical protein TNCV_935521 [Trichonephila clavipes]